MICRCCGKEFTVLYPDLWAYKVGGKWFCTWKCLRADEKKGENEVPRMKKDGTPAKKPGPRKTKESLLEKMPERFIKKDEYEETLDKLEAEVAAVINDDVPMTAEEREAKYPLIPTRVESRTGTWEIVEGYAGGKTLIGFRAKQQHRFGPLDNTAYALVLTADEWDQIFSEMEQVMFMMKL